MKYITRLEDILAKQFAKLPTIPVKLRSWIGENIWWFVFAFALIYGVSLLFAIIALLLAGRDNQLSSIYLNTATSQASQTINIIVSLVFGVIVTILMFMAITPLKEKRYTGWQRLFLIVLITVVSAIVSYVILYKDITVTNVFTQLLTIAIQLYVLFQIRGEFGSRASRAVEAEVVEAEIITKPRKKK